jgi:hypothetical protein
MVPLDEWDTRWTESVRWAGAFRPDLVTQNHTKRAGECAPALFWLCDLLSFQPCIPLDHTAELSTLESERRIQRLVTRILSPTLQ